MPIVRKLVPEEIQAVKTNQRERQVEIAAEYDALLDGFVVGDCGEIQLHEDEVADRIRIRKHLRAAAARKNIAIQFKRKLSESGLTFQFCVIQQSSEQKNKQ